jgi:hypothetical protein
MYIEQPHLCARNSECVSCSLYFHFQLRTTNSNGMYLISLLDCQSILSRVLFSEKKTKQNKKKTATQYIRTCIHVDIVVSIEDRKKY